jgi:hypothetical protein
MCVYFQLNDVKLNAFIDMVQNNPHKTNPLITGKLTLSRAPDIIQKKDAKKQPYVLMTTDSLTLKVPL